MQQLAATLYAETGIDALGVMQPQGAQKAPQRGAQPPAGKSMGQAQKAAQTANMTSYGERLAANAKPNMEAQA